MTAGSIVVPHIIPIRSPQSGKAKHEIDTTTVVEIKSDTQDVIIYYTLDGSKPEVVKRPGLGESSTLKYRKPICLPDGKVAVKAVAVTRDGRESAVVTKLFLVEYVPPSEALDDQEENVPEDHELGINKQLSKETNGSIARTTGTSAESLLKPQVLGPKMNEGSSNRPPKAPRFLSSRLGLTSHVSEPTSPHTLNASLEESTFNNLTNTHISRIQRETDFLRCTKCLSLRPSDPFARFCLQCGTAVPLVPGHKLPPTEGGQLGLCIHCKTIVPMNTVACVVCEAPIGPQLQPQASLRVQDKLICQSCGTGNPAHMSFCVTCETRLAPPPTAVLSGQSAPPLPSGENKMVSCSKCNRVNHSDARFCDWCGTKPGHAASCIRCSRCGASSHPYASFCGSCGVFMEGPSRGESCVSMASSPGGTVEQEQPSTQRSDATPWQPGPPSGPFVMAPGRVEQHTQTTGLFYPSSMELHRKGQQATLELSRQDQTRDRRPLLTAISPGRGFWRKQLDHVCAHLRSYTQNNPEFRALVGEPRMGRMVSAVIEEDNYEVSLRINFVSAEQEKNRVCQGGGSEKSSGLSESQKLSSVTEGRSLLSSSHTSLGNERSGANARTSKKPNESLSSYFLKQAPLQPTKDSQLLKEVGPDGKGQISVVQQLLDEGADPVCQGADGRPALVVAVVNGHADVIPVLVQRGADINQPSGPWNNTALHEAASMGSRGLLCAETLLGCNASIRRKNSQGLTAYEVAVSTECSPLVSLLAARMGQSMLDRLLTGAQVGLDGLR